MLGHWSTLASPLANELACKRFTTLRNSDKTRLHFLKTLYRVFFPVSCDRGKMFSNCYLSKSVGHEAGILDNEICQINLLPLLFFSLFALIKLPENSKRPSDLGMLSYPSRFIFFPQEKHTHTHAQYNIFLCVSLCVTVKERLPF